MEIAFWILLAALLVSAANVLLFACFAVSSAETFAEERELLRMERQGIGMVEGAELAGRR